MLNEQDLMGNASQTSNMLRQTRDPPECSWATGLASYGINYADGAVKIAPSFSKA